MKSIILLLQTPFKSKKLQLFSLKTSTTTEQNFSTSKLSRSTQLLNLRQFYSHINTLYCFVFLLPLFLSVLPFKIEIKKLAKTASFKPLKIENYITMRKNHLALKVLREFLAQLYCPYLKQELNLHFL